MLLKFNPGILSAAFALYDQILVESTPSIYKFLYPSSCSFLTVVIPIPPVISTTIKALYIIPHLYAISARASGGIFPTYSNTCSLSSKSIICMEEKSSLSPRETSTPIMYLCSGIGSFHIHNELPINLPVGSIRVLFLIYSNCVFSKTLSPEPKNSQFNSWLIFLLSYLSFLTIFSYQVEHGLYPFLKYESNSL